MLKTLLAIAAFTLPYTAPFTGEPFPALTGETLEGKTITIPTDTKGKKTLIGMAYSQKAEDALVTWYEPVFDKFVAKVGMFDKDYDVNLYFIPMFIGLKQAAYEPTKKKLKEDNRKDLFPYILFYKGYLEPYDSKLKMSDKDAPYFFVLDKTGTVIYSTSGAFTEKKMEEIEEAVNN
jgi:hypothetical protein